LIQWKIINRKQSARWQHLSRLKASAFLFEKKFAWCYETQLINRKQSARWQHLSQLKGSAFLFEKKIVRRYETQQLMLEIGNAILGVIEPYNLKISSLHPSPIFVCKAD
jgi:hypothetical protein